MVPSYAICVAMLFLSQVSRLLVKMKSQNDPHCRALGVSFPPFNGRRFSQAYAVPLGRGGLTLLICQLATYYKKENIGVITKILCISQIDTM